MAEYIDTGELTSARACLNALKIYQSASTSHKSCPILKVAAGDLHSSPADFLQARKKRCRTSTSFYFKWGHSSKAPSAKNRMAVAYCEWYEIFFCGWRWCWCMPAWNFCIRAQRIKLHWSEFEVSGIPWSAYLKKTLTKAWVKRRIEKQNPRS